MRIAILSSYFFREVEEIHGQDRIIFGGAERYLIELVKFLETAGHEVAVYQPLDGTVRIPPEVNYHIVAAIDWTAEKTRRVLKNFRRVADGLGCGSETEVRQIIKTLNKLGIETCRVDSPAGGKTRRVQFGQLTKEYAGVKFICLDQNDWRYETNPGLNFAFNEISLFFDLRIYFAPFLAWPELRRPAITISHGLYWDFPQHLIKVGTEIDRREFMRRHLHGLTEADVCVAVDTNVRNFVAATVPGKERRILVVPNFVDTEKFRPVAKDWEGIRVLYPRRLTAHRGCNDFFKVSQELPQYEYIVCGQAGDIEAQQRLENWGKATSRVKFVWRPLEAMEEIYQQADLAVIPTRAAEGTSLACLEAMACGLPVITTPVGGLSNLVIDGYNGLVVDLNHADLVEPIRFLAENAAVRAKFGQRNREIAVEAFDLKLWQTQWRNIIDSL